MACLNSVDLIATPGKRYVTMFQAPDGQTFRQLLASALRSCGWLVERADTGGANPGVGYKCTSLAVPWCAQSDLPANFVGKCKIWFYPFPTFTTNFQEQTEFKVSNEAESMISTGGPLLLPTANLVSFGDYSKYTYMVIVTPYDCKVFMLGVRDRINRGISNLKTAVFFGSPQIPSFVQARGAWCKGGVNESFYMVDASSMRTGGTIKNNGFFAAGVQSEADSLHGGGTFTNSNVGGLSTESRFAWMVTYGASSAQGDASDGMWVSDGTTNQDNWRGLIFPPLISWAVDPANPSTTRRRQGFMWDAIAVNHWYPGDKLLRFDGKQFIVFTHDWHGSLSPYIPAGALLLRTA